MAVTDWLKNLAPLLGTALGGPLGGAAASFIADKLGIESKTLEAVGEVLNGGKLSPEQISGLKLAEIDFQKFLEANKIAVEVLDAGDRKDARDLQKTAPSFVPALLTCFVVGAFTATLVLLLKFDVPATNRDIVVYMIGQLSGGFTSALAFWLGTTRDSGRKTELLAQSPGNTQRK